MDTPDEKTVSTEDLRQFAKQLLRMAIAHEEMAKWVDELGVSSLGDTNLKTANVSMGHLWAFLASVMRAYGSQVKERPPEVSEVARNALFESLMRSPNPPRRPKEDATTNPPPAEVSGVLAPYAKGRNPAKSKAGQGGAKPQGKGSIER